jgi:hypothetical protein
MGSREVIKATAKEIKEKTRKSTSKGRNSERQNDRTKEETVNQANEEGSHGKGNRRTGKGA